MFLVVISHGYMWWLYCSQTVCVVTRMGRTYTLTCASIQNVDGPICIFDGTKEVTRPFHICSVIQSLVKLDHIIIIIFIKLGSPVTK